MFCVYDFGGRCKNTNEAKNVEWNQNSLDSFIFNRNKMLIHVWRLLNVKIILLNDIVDLLYTFWHVQ